MLSGPLWTEAGEDAVAMDTFHGETPSIQTGEVRLAEGKRVSWFSAWSLSRTQSGMVPPSAAGPPRRWMVNELIRK